MQGKSKLEKKNYFTALILTLIFGPLGMFYISPGQGVGWTIGGLFAILLTAGAGAPFVWVLSILAGLRGVQSFNKYVDESDRALANVIDSQEPAKAPMIYPPERDPRNPKILRKDLII